MRLFRGASLDVIYKQLVAELLIETFGDDSRLGPAADLGPTTLVIEPGELKLIGNPGRAINPKLALVEACWILSGSNSVEPLAAIAPRFRRFSDDGSVLSGAYGERLRTRYGFDQLEQIAKALKADPTSRRAFSLIADASDVRSSSRDVPCNIGILWRIRDDRLHMTVLNRSNDAIFGVPYDIFSFSLLHFWMARAVAIGVGDHVHVANSMHLYAANRDIAERVVAAALTPFMPGGVTADAFMDELLADHDAMGRLDPNALRSSTLRRLFDAPNPAAGSSPTSDYPWLDQLVAQWKSRPRSSVVAAAPAI